MLKRQFVLGRPPNPCFAVEVAEMNAAILRAWPLRTRASLRTYGRTIGRRRILAQALGQETGATHGP